MSSLHGFIFILNVTTYKMDLISSKRLEAFYHHPNTGPCFSFDLCIGYESDMKTISSFPNAYGISNIPSGVFNERQVQEATDVEVLYAQGNFKYKLLLTCESLFSETQANS